MLSCYCDWKKTIICQSEQLWLWGRTDKCLAVAEHSGHSSSLFVKRFDLFMRSKNEDGSMMCDVS